MKQIFVLCAALPVPFMLMLWSPLGFTLGLAFSLLALVLWDTYYPRTFRCVERRISKWWESLR